MKLSAFDPDDETLRVAIELWKSTWISSVVLGSLDDEGRALVTIELSEDWERSPVGARQWLAGSAFK